ncbi:MAG: hypothetical protein KatS3mg131_2127 [Candidatus Tectimicrobiota bacterium]|nr:MAG: hypothetical protein KatS3mg131_2127 [Candidatus Tectomicrobia bacterium]
MPARVVDASLLGAVAFQEPRSAEAVALLEGMELYAPTLLAYELASIARKKALRYPAFARELLEALADALALDIRWMEVDHRGVVALSLATGLSTYDASYLYLARALGIPLVTFDQVLQRVPQESGGQAAREGARWLLSGRGRGRRGSMAADGSAVVEQRYGGANKGGGKQKAAKPSQGGEPV